MYIQNKIIPQKHKKSIYNLKRPIFYGLLLVISAPIPSIILIMVWLFAGSSYWTSVEMGGLAIIGLVFLGSSLLVMAINSIILFRYENPAKITKTYSKSYKRLYFFILAVCFIIVPMVASKITSSIHNNQAKNKCYKIIDIDARTKCIQNIY